MGEAIGQVLSLGVGVALSPMPIIAIVLMLGTRRARTTGPAFLVGWLAGLSVIGCIVLLLAGGAGASDDGDPATWVSLVKLALGALLLLLAVRTWRGRPRADAESAMPKWMAAMDTFTVVKSAGVGAALSGINPKNLMLTVGAGTAIAETGAPLGQEFVALAVFVVIGALGPGVPLAVYFLLGTRAEPALAAGKDWMVRHNAAIMTAVMLLMGTKILGDAISALAG